MSAGTRPDGQGSMGAPGVRLVGRFDKTDAQAPRFAWSGSGIIARFSGTTVGVRLAGGQQFTVLVDGVAQPRWSPLPVTGALSPIASGLSPGDHRVEIYRRTEADQGESQFLGFDFGDGALLPPPPAPARRIEIIGDSISCGFGIEGVDMNCRFTPDTENHYLTYGALTARALKAELVTLAWSGKGVVCNYGEDPARCAEPLPVYYERTLPAREDSWWDFASWQPQVVVVNLGTNDFSTPAAPTDAQFTAAYRGLLHRIREKYAEAAMICTVAPMLEGRALRRARGAIDQAIRGVGDSKIEAFAIEPADPADGWGCEFHPSVKTHEKMAKALTRRLRGALGW